jgi:hypothetical protein
MGSSPKKRTPQSRIRHSDRKARLDVVRSVMADMDWNAQELAHEAGVSKKTIERMLEGKYVRHNIAKRIQTFVRQYSEATLFEGDPLPVSADQAPSSSVPLEAFYAACERAPLEIRQALRVRQFRELIEDRMAKFVGRDWLFAALDRFLTREPSGYFLVRGMPGVGKTAFAAAVTQRRGCVHYFNSRFERLTGADQFLGCICAQLVARYSLPHQRIPARVQTDSGLVVEVLAEAARRHPNQKIIVVVDALDEADYSARRDSNPLALPRQLPANCYFLLTTRDTATPFRTESPVQQIYLDQSSSGNLADVREYLHTRARSSGIVAYCRHHQLDSSSFVELLEEKSLGNFMYLHYILPEMERGRWSLQTDQELPIGLANYYESHWQLLRREDEEAWFKYKLPVLKILASAAGPVPLRLLKDRLRRVSQDMIRDVLTRDWRQFLERVPLTIRNRTVTAWKLYHTSFADFLRDKAEDPSEQFDLEREREKWFKYGQAHGMTPD